MAQPLQIMFILPVTICTPDVWSLQTSFPVVPTHLTRAFAFTNHVYFTCNQGPHVSTVPPDRDKLVSTHLTRTTAAALDAESVALLPQFLIGAPLVDPDNLHLDTLKLLLEIREVEVSRLLAHLRKICATGKQDKHTYTMLT